MTGFPNGLKSAVSINMHLPFPLQKYGGDFSFLLNRRNDWSVKGGYSYDLTESGGSSVFDDYESILSGNWRALMIKSWTEPQNANLSMTIRARTYWLLKYGASWSFKINHL